MSDLHASFAHEGLLLSLVVPADWEAEESAPNQVRFYAPAQPDLGGHRPTMSFSVGEPEGTGQAWFDGFCADAGERLEGHVGYRLLRRDRFTLSSLVSVEATWYEWSPAPNTTVTQLQALVPVNASRMYTIHAAVPACASDRLLPAFEEVLRSLRVLPPRPSVFFRSVD